VDLQETAAGVEKAVKHDRDDDLPERLEAFDRSLHQVLESLTGADLKRDIETEENVAGPAADPSLLRELLEKMTPFVNKRKPKQCKEIIHEADGLTWPEDLTADVKKLKTLIKRFKFKEARPVLEVLIEKLRDTADSG
jgi:hypothetical protein